MIYESVNICEYCLIIKKVCFIVRKELRGIYIFVSIVVYCFSDVLLKKVFLFYKIGDLMLYFFKCGVFL